MESQSPTPRLLDQVRSFMRLHHYSIHTERTYLDWTKRYVQFHHMQTRDDLADGERKIEEFLTHLAVSGNVSASTQNQAMNALVFLYKRVLENPLGGKIDAVRADRKLNVPVVLTRAEVGKIIPLLEGTPQLIVKLLYGSGLRILEAVRLRVKDLDFQMRQVTVRSGKGDKDRFTTLSAGLIPLLENHLQKVKSAPRSRSGRRTWSRLFALRPGTEISQCRQGMELAISLSRPGCLHRSIGRNRQAAPRRSGGG